MHVMNAVAVHGPDWGFACALVVQLLIVAWRDFRRFTISNRACLLLLATVALAVLWGLFGPPVLGFGLSSVWVAALYFAVVFPLWLWGKFGGGDVKFMAVCGAIAGPSYGGPFVLVASVLCLVTVACVLLVRSWPTRLPARPEGLWHTYRTTRHLPLGVPLGLASIAIVVVRVLAPS